MFDLFLFLFFISALIWLLLRRIPWKRFAIFGICLLASTCHWNLSREKDVFPDLKAVARALPHHLLARQIDGLGPGYRVVAVDGDSVGSIGELEKKLENWILDLKVLSIWWRGRLEKLVLDRTFLEAESNILSSIGMVPNERIVIGEGALFLQSAFLSVEYFREVRETKFFQFEFEPNRKFFFLKNPSQGFRALRARNRAYLIVENWLWDSHNGFFPLYRGVEVSPPILFSLGEQGLVSRLKQLPRNFKNNLYSWNYLPWTWRELQHSPISGRSLSGMISVVSLLMIFFPAFLYSCGWGLALGIFSVVSILSMLLMLSWPQW